MTQQTHEADIAYSSYRSRLDRVVDHIHTHLDEDIRIEQLAEVARLSPYHWHRIYTAMRGETVAVTVRRLRLQRAADRLANSVMAVRDVAAQAGFSAVESFTRAFKQAYGKSPADYRAAGSHAAFKAANAAGDTDRFKVTVAEQAGQRLAAVAHRGSYMQIDHAFGALFGALTAQQLMDANTAMIGIFQDDPDAVTTDELRSFACSPIAEYASLAAPLESVIAPAGLYATLRYQGPYADMKDAYRWLYGVWLPASGYLPADTPAQEEYLSDPRQVAPADLLTDIRMLLRPMA